MSASSSSQTLYNPWLARSEVVVAQAVVETGQFQGSLTGLGPASVGAIEAVAAMQKLQWLVLPFFVSAAFVPLVLEREARPGVS
jgi:hypothetical protein